MILRKCVVSRDKAAKHAFFLHHGDVQNERLLSVKRVNLDDAGCSTFIGAHSAHNGMAFGAAR